MKKLTFLTFIFGFFFLYANESINFIYNVKNWKAVDNSHEGNISIKKDQLSFRGKGIQSIYQLSLSKSINKHSSLISWEMESKQNFIILLQINTKNGVRYLTYPKEYFENKFYFNLDTNVTNKSWIKIQRNIEKDLQRFEPDNTLLELLNFVVKGDGSLAKIKFSNPKENFNLFEINGQNLIYLKKEQEYLEQGVIATDNKGYPVDIEISSNVDSYVNGEYSVMYYKKSKKGKLSTLTRKVIVGNKKIELEETTEIEEAEEEYLPYVEGDENLIERNILAYEKQQEEIQRLKDNFNPDECFVEKGCYKDKESYLQFIQNKPIEEGIGSPPINK